MIILKFCSQRKKNEKKARSRATRRCNSDESETTTTNSFDVTTNDEFKRFFIFFNYLFLIFFKGLTWAFIKTIYQLIIVETLFVNLWFRLLVMVLLMVLIVEEECLC